MPANFSRLKTWASLEVLTNEDLNDEFDNIINSLSNTTLDDYSTNVAQMQLQTSPGTVGSESLATSLAGELERIRFVIARITGKTYWYDAPARTLESYNPVIDYYLPFDGVSVVDAIYNSVSRGIMPNGRNAIDVGCWGSSSAISSLQSKFGLYSHPFSTSEIPFVTGTSANVNKSTKSCHLYGVNANQGIFYNIQQGIEAYLTASGFIEFKITERTPVSNTTKRTKTITGNSSVSGLASWNCFNFKYTMNGANGSGADRMRVRYNGSAVGTDLTSQTINVNVGDGGQWIYGARRQDPTWSTEYAANVVPGSDGFTATGAGSDSVSDGVLSVTTTSLNTQRMFSKSTGVDFGAGQGFCADFKMRVTSYVFNAGAGSAGGPYTDTPVQVNIRDDSENRSLNIFFGRSSIILRDGITGTNLVSVANNNDSWHTYRVTIDGTTKNVQFYIDGQAVLGGGQLALTTADATAADLFQFGDPNTTANCSSTTEWEFVKWGSGTLSNYNVAPFTNQATGYIDDIASISDDYDSSSLDSTLVNQKASDAYLSDKPRAHFWKMIRNINGFPLVSSTFGTAWANITTFSPSIVSDGKTPILIIGKFIGYNGTAGEGGGVAIDTTAFQEASTVNITDSSSMGFISDYGTHPTANGRIKLVATGVVTPTTTYTSAKLLLIAPIAGTFNVENSHTKVNFIYPAIP